VELPSVIPQSDKSIYVVELVLDHSHKGRSPEAILKRLERLGEGFRFIDTQPLCRHIQNTVWKNCRHLGADTRPSEYDYLLAVRRLNKTFRHLELKVEPAVNASVVVHSIVWAIVELIL